MGKEALAVERTVLFRDMEFEGFMELDKFNFISVILDNYIYHLRGDELEHNDSLQQIIPYVWIVNPVSKEVFVYRRASGKENYSESRLMNKISCGVGGHIDREDSDNPIENAMMRELMEEVKMEEYPKPKIIGYINDDSDSVGKVHFGIVALAESIHKVEKGDDEMVEGKFYSIEELDKLLADSNNEADNWTRISWPFIKNYLNRI